MFGGTRAPLRGALGLACALLLGAAAPSAFASHVGEELLLDQQAVATNDQFVTALRQYEAAPAAQKAVAAQRLVEVAQQRRDRMLALMERNPRVAASRALPQALRDRLPEAARAFVEQPVVMTGVLRATVASDFQRGRSTTTMELVDDARRRATVHVADASERQMLAWVNRRVTMEGLKLDRRLLVSDRRQVQLLAADGAGGATGTTSTSTASIRGDQKTLVVLANYTDKPLECSAADIEQRFFGASGATVNEGYRQSSGGLTTVSGRVVGPVTLPMASTAACDIQAIATAADAAARAAGADPATYQRIAYALPLNATCGWSGIAELGGSLPTRSWVQRCGHTQVFSHELGHNLGFHHATSPAGEYGDGTDPMGAPQYLVTSHAANRVMADWLPASRIQDVTTASSYAVASLNNAAATAPQVLRLRKADTNDYYYVSLRQPEGLDAGLLSHEENTVSVHQASGALPSRTIRHALLAPGQSWTDGINGITVTHQSLAAGTATVGVGFGGSGCTRSAPAVSLAPGSQTAAPGASLAYSVTLKNNNSAGCGTSTFQLAQSLPAGFTGSFSTSSASLAPGSATTVNWSVASGSTSASATYTLTATASEAAVSNAGQVHASYVVYAPPPPVSQPVSVAIVTPSSGAAIKGKASITANANAVAGVARVEFYVDGQLLATDVSSPYGTSWNLRRVAPGQHVIRVKAVDTAGASAEHSVGVTVN